MALGECDDLPVWAVPRIMMQASTHVSQEYREDIECDGSSVNVHSALGWVLILIRFKDEEAYSYIQPGI